MSKKYIWQSTLPRLNHWEHYYNSIVEQHLNSKYGKSLNFAILEDKYGELSKLYDSFLLKAEKAFGPLKILENNSRKCAAYVGRGDDYRSSPHHHMKTSVINAVYYFSVPTAKYPRDGGIAFYDDNKKEIYYHQPKEEDLLMFPNYLIHMPLPISSPNVYRIAINMEIMCEWPKLFPTKYLGI